MALVYYAHNDLSEALDLLKAEIDGDGRAAVA